MSDPQKIERLATEVMGWTWRPREQYPNGAEYWCDSNGICHTQIIWNPLTDWNHWRQVELKVMEDNDLWLRFVRDSKGFTYEMSDYMKMDLHTRVDALIAALDSSSPSSDAN